MKRLPQIALLADGKRLHLQDGPIDLIVEARGTEASVRAAYDAAAQRFTGLLDELCEELTELRKAADPARCSLKGIVARRMHAAVAPFATAEFITPMAAVAGSVAEEILAAMLRVAPLDRAYVNNGGDIALHLTGREQFSVGLMDRPDCQGVMRTMTIDADDAIRGVATSGRHGRSFSLGIADAVTVLARTACASRCRRHHHRQCRRSARPSRGSSACRPTNCSPTAISARGSSPATSAPLSADEIETALEAGARRARQLLAAGLIEGAALRLLGETVVVGAKGIAGIASRSRKCGTGACFMREREQDC